MKYDKIALASLRGLALDEITKANSGHPGMALSAAPLIYTLYTRHLIADPSNPTWINRDRFILSAGHGSALLYALLHLAGYPLPMDQLKQFRALDSLCPGHPEVGLTPGVDCTSGPLGQGIAQAVGFALAESHLRALYPEGENLIDHYTYCLTGDGCLEEGVSQEAISFAGTMKLNRLILLYDRNDCTLDGPLSNSSNEDVLRRFEAEGWNTLEVEDGNDLDAIDHAITLAKTAKEKPTIILCHTVIGYGSPFAGSHVSHGKAFSPEDVVKTKENLGYPFAPFDVPAEAYMAFKLTFAERGHRARLAYEEKVASYKKNHPDTYATFLATKDNDITPFLFKSAPKYEEGFKDATRNESGALLNVVAEEVPTLFGGAADVAGSVKTAVKKFRDYSPEHPEGSNINFGIREFAMASIENGILLHKGLRTYCGCFLVFSDYMKAALRMSAMEHLPSVYLFSHDSILLGEDGMTHQPIEQITMIRTIPNFVVFRPCDAIETAAAYRSAFSSTDHPTALILSRQKLPNLKGSSFEGTLRGGYILSKEQKTPSLTLIATGSEVSLALDIQAMLLADGIDTRVVSLPSTNLFDAQSKEYREEVYGVPYEKRVFLELGKSDILYKYAGNVFGIDRFGLSAPGEKVAEKLGYTAPLLAEKIRKLVA